MKRKIALITGGVGGIGTAISMKLAADGVFVVANYIVPGSEAVWHESMKKAGFGATECATIAADVSDFGASEKMVADVAARFGNIDILVNCAGVTRDASFRKMSLEQ